MALFMTLNRKIHLGYNRVKVHNFSIDGLAGFTMFGKTAGVLGTGKIGTCFGQMCTGFGMKVLGYDVYQNEEFKKIGTYVTMEELF